MKKTVRYLLVLGGLLIAATVSVFLIPKPGLRREQVILPGIEAPESDLEPETEREDKPEIAPEVQTAPDLLPETEAEEEPESPMLTEEDGITRLEIEGVSLLLVNKQYSLPADYGGRNQEAAAALEEMIAAAAEDDLALFVISGYRSYETQMSIYNRYVGTWGKEYTDRVSARPGHSEHQTGLAYDLNSLENSFKDTEEFRWLERHSAEFGFILRYREGSEWATGYMFEPWHYRYIGDVPLAKKIMESGLSLEEYAGLAPEGSMASYRD